MTTWIAILLTALGVMGVVGQIVVARRQARLQKLQAIGTDAERWLKIRDDWHLALLVAYGPGFARRAGVMPDTARRFREDLKCLVEAELQARDAYHEAETSEQAQAAFDIGNDAFATLVPYQRAVARVVEHLAGMCSLILEGTLSSDDAYAILGPEVVEHRHAVRRLLEISTEASGHPGARWGRAGRWSSSTLDEVAKDIGWDDGLWSAVGTRYRAVLLLDLLTASAVKAGDAADTALLTELVRAVQDQQVQTAWATAATHGRRAAWKAIGELMKAARQAPDIEDVLQEPTNFEDKARKYIRASVPSTPGAMRLRLRLLWTSPTLYGLGPGRLSQYAGANRWALGEED